MAVPLSLGDFEVADSPPALPSLGSIFSDGLTVGHAAEGGGGGWQERQRAASENFRSRRASSPRLNHSHSGSSLHRARASTSETGSFSRSRGQFSVGKPFERGRTQSAGKRTSWDQRQRSVGSYDAAAAIAVGLPAAAAAAAASRGHAEASTDHAQLERGTIELYVSPTAEEELDALFYVLGSEEIVPSQVPLRHRNLPYSFFQETAELGSATSAYLGDVLELDSPAGIGTSTAESHYEDFSFTPTATERQYTFPEQSHLAYQPDESASDGLTPTLGSMTVDGRDIIDQLIQGVQREGNPEAAVSGLPALDVDLAISNSSAAASTAAMDADFLSNLDLDF